MQMTLAEAHSPRKRCLISKWPKKSFFLLRYDFKKDKQTNKQLHDLIRNDFQLHQLKTPTSFNLTSPNKNQEVLLSFSLFLNKQTTKKHRHWMLFSSTVNHIDLQFQASLILFKSEYIYSADWQVHEEYSLHCQFLAEYICAESKWNHLWNLCSSTTYLKIPYLIFCCSFQKQRCQRPASK